MYLMSRAISGIKVFHVITTTFKCEHDKLLFALNKTNQNYFEYWNSDIENTLSVLNITTLVKIQRFDPVKADESV